MDTFTYKDKTYTLTDDAVLSNRAFNGGWFDATDGEPYTAEYHANAVDDTHHDYMVYWQFETIKGQEPEDESNYPWDVEHISKIEQQ